MAITRPGPYTRAADAAASLLAAHPGLCAESVDVAHVTGLGPAALIQLASKSALQAWAQALNTHRRRVPQVRRGAATARTTGASGYGTTEPHQPTGLPDWLWWRMTFIDTTVDQMPIRLWTLDTTDQPRALATFLASTAHTPSAPPGDRTQPPNHPNTPEENSR